MKLEEVTMEIRPRSDYEAIDSGFGLVRRDFWRCLMLWWMAFFPILLLIPLMSLWVEAWILLAWWWKLSGCRLVVFQLSRRLFGEQPSWRDLWRELPHAWFRRFFYRMCWARFSPWKAISMIVEDLESLRGKPYRTRVQMVLRRGESSVMLLFFLSIVGTLVLTQALLGLGVLLIPQGMEEQAEAVNWFSEESPPMTLGLKWACAAAATIAASLIDVFFTGAGFGLYVNSRTWVEGWDIELAFKRLANRLNNKAQALILALLLGGTGVVASAAHGQEFARSERPREMIERIKADEDFTIHKEKYKVPKYTPPTPSGGNSGDLLSVLRGIGYMILAVCGAGLLGLIGWLIYRSRLLRRVDRANIRKSEKPSVEVVMGMEVCSETLPDDVVADARRMWADGDFSAALGLLYRASLSWWIHHGGVEIGESDTEGDCLRGVRARGHEAVGYFEKLTNVRLRSAYARDIPTEHDWNELCAEWPFSTRRAKR